MSGLGLVGELVGKGNASALLGGDVVAVCDLDGGAGFRMSDVGAVWFCCGVEVVACSSGIDDSYRSGWSSWLRVDCRCDSI